MQIRRVPTQPQPIVKPLSNDAPIAIAATHHRKHSGVHHHADTFQHHKHHAHHPHHAHHAHHTHGTGGPSHGGSAAAFDAARSVLGRNIQDLKYHGPLAQFLDKWPSSHVCCANFVSACLEKAGQISPSEHNDNVRGLSHNLRADPRWEAVSIKNAKPGDVVCFDVPGEGHMAHVEMFAGHDASGRSRFIGSNNVNPDGSQRISEGHVGYGVDIVWHFKG